VRPAVPAGALPLPAEIDHSCRVPVLFLLISSVVWLIVSLVFGVLASIKMHAPGFLADVAPLTYGRVAGVASSTFLYGFASQAAIAAGLWLFARTGKTFLILPGGSLVAAFFWNAGVLVGNVGILIGSMTQYPSYQMPAWSSPILFIAFLILGLAGLLTFVSRLEKTLYTSVWFLIAGFLIFPWIFSVAFLLLGHYTIRGVFEPVVALWFSNNFIMLWLGSMALAILFYFIPRLSGQPLYSYALAVFGFWFYLLFSTASGFQNTPGLPNWMPTLSTVTNVLVLLPAAAIAVNWYRTWAGHNRAKKEKEPAAKYASFAAFAFFVAILLRTLLSCPSVDEAVGLTIFKTGVSNWTIYGFIGMALFAAIVHILPRLVEVDWPSMGMVKLHYGLTVLGIVLVTAAMMLGGYVEGNGMNNPGVAFNTVVKQMTPYIGINSLGILVLLAAQLVLLWNMILLAKCALVNCCGLRRAAR
jgi:cytochrome c oxidase cbb3-type subunit 1